MEVLAIISAIFLVYFILGFIAVFLYLFNYRNITSITISEILIIATFGIFSFLVELYELLQNRRKAIKARKPIEFKNPFCKG